MTNITAPVTLPDTGVSINPPLEVDLYDIVYRKEIDYNTLQNLFTEALDQTPGIVTSSGIAGIGFRGWTPFNAPQAISLSGIKILKKTKYFVPFGDSVTHQIRDSRNRYFNSADVTNSAKTKGFLAPGGRATRSIMIIAKPVGGIVPSTGTTSFLKVASTRAYTYKILQNNSNERFSGYVQP